jgi:hypothetical protein
VSSSGTGEYRSATGQSPAEQHLGDRLAAFVDGELSDDSRDRVLAHLATCPQCKAAADEQRRLKNVIAASQLPAISAGLLARLQQLPGSGEGKGPSAGPAGASPQEPGRRRGPFDGGLLGSGTFGSGRRGDFSYLSPAPDMAAAVADASRAAAQRGFRVHEPSRGRRIAFAAAGAFSMAAIALGSALPMEAAVDGGARPDEGPAVLPLNADSVSDTRGVVPRGLLESSGRQAERPPAPAVAAASGSSATSVSLSTGSSFVLH